MINPLSPRILAYRQMISPGQRIFKGKNTYNYIESITISYDEIVYCPLSDTDTLFPLVEATLVDSLNSDIMLALAFTIRLGFFPS
jgi:hypothetical protein